MSMVPGLVRGLYVPTTSTGRPLRARSFSMTTMRYCGCLRAPTRDSRIINTDVYPCSGSVRRGQDKHLLCRRLEGMARVEAECQFDVCASSQKTRQRLRCT